MKKGEHLILKETKKKKLKSADLIFRFLLSFQDGTKAKMTAASSKYFWNRCSPFRDTVLNAHGSPNVGRFLFWHVFITKDSFLGIWRTENLHLHLCSRLLDFPESGAVLAVLADAGKHQRRAGKCNDSCRGIFYFSVKHLGNRTFGM